MFNVQWSYNIYYSTLPRQSYDNLDDFKIILWWSYNELTINVQWSHHECNIVSQPSHDNLMMI